MQIASFINCVQITGMIMKQIRSFLLITACLLCTATLANPSTAKSIAEPLQPWIDWVLEDESDYPCPFLYNSFEQKRCGWPSRLKLNLDKEVAEFSMQWKVFADSWIELPGDQKNWPLDVQANQKPALVMPKRGRPAIKLQPGFYQINGRFLWDSIPDRLQIPEDTGLIELTVLGQHIGLPILNRGQLWLKGGDLTKINAQNQENKLDLQVFRRIDDSVPLQLLTHLDLQVAGNQREIKLQLPLSENFIPMRLNSPLPARIEPDGRLLLQLRAGRWSIELLTRHLGPVSELSFKPRDKVWPNQEIWAFYARPHIRLVEIQNVDAIDAQLTNVPNAWKNLPIFRVNEGDTMEFKVIRRGDPDPEPDTLTLMRTLWLDFDGNGYTANDKITGQMTQSWRLNALPQTQLGKVSLDGRNQLITHLSGSEQQGVEVRKGRLNVIADSRINKPIERISAVGWEHTFHQVRTVLNLPPGWRLFAATGIDNVPNSWISRWTLLDLFLVLITSLAITRLWNFYWGLYALLTLALVWHEPDAPRFVWLNILAALALLRLLPDGRLFRFVKFYRNACWLALIVMLVPFLVDQVRTGLYPQLQMPWRSISAAIPQGIDVAEEMVTAPEVAEGKLMQRSLSTVRDQNALRPSKKMGARHRKLERLDPKANIQTGPGLPQWQWMEIPLSWNGPVDSEQKIRFWLLPPDMTMLLNFLRALLVTGLALLVFGRIIGKFKSTVNLSPLWLLMLPLFALPAHKVQADFPDAEMLKELKSRLLKAPDCLPSCAQIEQMHLGIDGRRMYIDLQLMLQDNVALPLPARGNQWMPNSVSINGTPAEALYRSRDGGLWINLDAGSYRLRMDGMTPPVNQFSLALPLNPHRITTRIKDWSIEGIHENKSAAGQIHLTRQTKDSGHANQFAARDNEIPPFVRVERTLQFGLDWWVETQITRFTPTGSAFILKVPLLNTESVTTEGIRVKDSEVLVNMPADQRVFRWRSILDKTPVIQLKAAQTDQWTEIWRADISPIWHMQSAGISAIHHQNKQGSWLPEWRPWPGETVTLTMSRPEAVTGRTLTIDNSRLRINVGKRGHEVTLHLTIRSSRGNQHVITLPTNAQLQSVSIDQRTQPIRQQDRRITLPIRPGSQQISVKWRATKPLAMKFTTPELDLGIDSVNTTLDVSLPDDRWTLFTTGPVFGPAVLFWGVLFVIAVLSYALGQITLTPLKNWHWFLLLVGLSQIPVESALIVVAWLVILGYRRGHEAEKAVYFNATQIGIGLLTLISLGLLFFAINQGLLGSPEMQISGNQSSAYHLYWYQDRSDANLPVASVFSIPLTVYRILMLGWSLWLAVSLLNWLKWGWTCFSSGGVWKKRRPKNKLTASEVNT